jgi:hypothetical protein
MRLTLTIVLGRRLGRSIELTLGAIFEAEPHLPS